MLNSPSPPHDPNSNSITTSESPALHCRPPLSGTFTDYQIVSTASKGWKYNVMKFAVTDPDDEEVEPRNWRQPIKLNRKDYQPPKSSAGGNSANGGGSGAGDEERSSKVMLGDDGRPVIGFDGRIVMVDSDGKVVPPAGSSTNDGTKSKNKSKRRMKEVVLVPEEARKLIKEEMYPWVIEEAPKEVKPDVSNDDSDTSTSPAPTVTPGEVWSGHLLDPEASQTHAIFVLSGSTFQFIRSNRFYTFTKQKKDVPDAAKLKGVIKKSEKSARLFQEWTTSRNMGGNDDEGGEDDDEEERVLQGERLEHEGDTYGMEYEHEYADDDDRVRMDGDDEEAKETEERLKREYRMANRARIDDEVDFMEEIDELTGAGRALRKLVKRNGEDETYDSDENPYVSDEEDEYDPVPLDGPAVMDQQQDIPASTSVLPSGSTPDTSQSQPPPTTAVPNVLTSTGVSSTKKAATNLKRKAPDGDPVPPGADADSSIVNDLPRKKSRRSPGPGPLTEDMVISFLREKGPVTTKEIIQKFQSYLRDEETKKAFGNMVKKVAIQVPKNNTLVLREEFRDA